MNGPGVESTADVGSRPIALILLIAALVLVLVLPVDFTLSVLDQGTAERLRALAGTIGVVALAIGLHGLGRPRRGWAWLLPVLALLLLVRLVQYGTVQFSGAGFTDEFFLHLEGESARVALQEFDRLARRGLILLVLMVGAVLLATRRPLFGRPRAAGGVVAVGLALVLVFRAALPEWQLLQGWRDWVKPPEVAVDQAVLDRWSASGLVEVEVREKWQVEAALPEQPKNLIVLYLESVGVNLTEQADWPDLMPNLDRLIEQNGWVDHLWTSSYITIEGITNTQCGTLLPFDRGSESMADGDGVADALPCLGDVLDAAGYYQVYLGGAETTFAGKGAFLNAHGFDEVRGLEHWREQGLHQRPGTWGLADPDLFDQSLAAIERLQASDRPWNLTLLTIGTHLPGYRYDECAPYPNGRDVFLHALHCTDQLLGRWVETLRQRGVLDDAVLVITADHQVFPNADMKALFGEAVYDRRLPMVVLGPTTAAAQVQAGSGYDFAPTVLDLLEIRHDAEFVLGRSLARPVERPAYLVTRYDDVLDGQRLRNDADCSNDRRPTPPIDACEKQELLAVLGAIATSYSRPPPMLDCRAESVDRVRLAPDGRGLVTVTVGGEEQAGRFIHNGRTVAPERAGWSIVLFDETGRIQGRPFIPADVDPGSRAEQLQGRFERAASALAIWSSPSAPTALPGLAFAPAGPARAWWLQRDGRVIAASTAAADDDGVVAQQLVFEPETCRRVIGQGALSTAAVR